MITVQKLAQAIAKRLGGTEAEALAESRTVMSYFGFRSVIIDNAIHPDDRKVFYALHDAGLLQSFWETVPLLDGRNWRIFYWSLNEADLDRILVDRLLGRGLFVHQNAVEIRFVQRPVEDSPVPAVQQGDGLPEALKQAGVVQRVEDLPVVRMDRVVDNHAPETEVTHHRARLRKGLRLGAAKAFRNGLRKLLDCDHLVLHFLR